MAEDKKFTHQFGITGGLGHALEDQQREAKRFRDLIDTSSITGGLGHVLERQQMEATRYRNLIDGSRTTGALGSILEDQQKETERFRNLIDTSSITGSLGHVLEKQQTEADRYRDLIGGSRTTGALGRILEDQQTEAERYRNLIDGSRITGALGNVLEYQQREAEHLSDFLNDNTRTQPFYETILASIGAIASVGYDPMVGAALGARRTVSYPHEEHVMNESPELQRKLRELESQLTQLRNDVADKTRALREQEAGAARKDGDIRELQQKYVELSEKQHLAHLLARVEPAAQRQLIESAEFRGQFDRQEPCDAFVMSIDLRRSTELMLKARDPKLFAQFIMGLTRVLREIVLLNHGIFDKFTGDGILAFFPTFYSGPDVGLLVLRAAQQAHEAFREHYDAHRHCFLTVLRDVGLGVGVDFGRVQIVQVGAEFTVVGTPVVYACRMAGADAGQTFVNQPAYEQLAATHSVVCDFLPVDLEIKNEGRTLAYSANLNGRPYEVTTPSWYSSDADSPT